MNRSANGNATKCESITIGWEFLALNLIVIVGEISATNTNAFAYFVLTKSRSLPSNVTLLLKNSALSASLTSALGSIRGLLGVYMYFRGFLPISRFLCAVCESPFSFLSFTFTLSVLIIGFDRLLSTRSRHSNTDDAPTPTAYVLIAAVWLMGLVMNCGLVLLSSFDPMRDEPMCYCSGLLAAPQAFPTQVAPFYMAIELFTVVCYLVVYKRSRTSYLSFSINTTQHCLSDRYQMISNIKTTILLMPGIVLHGVLYSVFALATIYAIQTRGLDMDSMFSINFFLIIFAVGSVESLAHPIWFLRHEHILRTASKYLPFLRRFSEKQRSDLRTMLGRPAQNGRVEPRSTPARCNPEMDKAELFVVPVARAQKLNPGVVEFRLQPDQTNDILLNIWASKPKKVN